MNVVFTGPAFDVSGHAVLRNDLVSACISKGNIFVQNNVRDTTDILVASRTDTVKASAAAKRGVAVFTYPEFIARFLNGVQIKDGGKPDKYVDVIAKETITAYFGPLLETFNKQKGPRVAKFPNVHAPELIDQL